MEAPQTPSVVRYAEAIVPTEYGESRLVVYRDQKDAHVEHCAIVMGDVADAEDLPVRVHSECFTGEVLHSLKCDCREQLDLALRRISEAGRGVVLYLRQEGRGIGLGNKIRAYALQHEGADTVDANLQLGFEADARRYNMVPEMLADLGVRSIALLTNNPDKLSEVRAAGVEVTGRLPIVIEAHDHNRDYLATKAERMGHLFNLR